MFYIDKMIVNRMYVFALVDGDPSVCVQKWVVVNVSRAENDGFSDYTGTVAQNELTTIGSNHSRNFDHVGWQFIFKSKKFYIMVRLKSLASSKYHE